MRYVGRSLQEAPQRSDTKSRAQRLPPSLLVGDLREACHTQRGQDGKGLKGSMNLQLAAESLGREDKGCYRRDAHGGIGHVTWMNSPQCVYRHLPGDEQACVP